MQTVFRPNLSTQDSLDLIHHYFVTPPKFQTRTVVAAEGVRLRITPHSHQDRGTHWPGGPASEFHPFIPCPTKLSTSSHCRGYQGCPHIQCYKNPTRSCIVPSSPQHGHLRTRVPSPGRSRPRIYNMRRRRNLWATNMSLEAQ